jgi:hypothetical protein
MLSDTEINETVHRFGGHKPESGGVLGRATNNDLRKPPHGSERIYGLKRS